MAQAAARTPACRHEGIVFVERAVFANHPPPGGVAVILLIGLAVLAFYLARLVRATVFQRNDNRRRYEYVLQYFRDAPCRRRRGVQACNRDESEVLAAVARGVRAKVEGNVAIAMPVLSSTGAGFMAWICINLLTSSPRWMPFDQTCIAVGACAIVIVASAFPSKVSTGRPGAVYCFVMATISALIFTTSSTTLAVFLTGAIAMLFRVAMSVTYHRTTLVVVWNLIYLACSFCTWMRTFGEMSAPVRSILATEACCTLAVLMLSHSAAHAAEADVRREVEASVLRSESSGLWNLLELICDVVVPLDELLKITDKASRFSALVTLQGGSMEGMRLQDFMPAEEDRDAFENIAQSGMQRDPVCDGALPHALHVKLKDSLGNLLRVELFCAPFSTLARRGYFVGIREWGDDTPMATCSSTGMASRRHSLPRSTRAGEPQPALVGRPCAEGWPGGAPSEGPSGCESSVSSDGEAPSLASSDGGFGGSTAWSGAARPDTDGLSSVGSLSSISKSSGSASSRSARHRRRLRQRAGAGAPSQLKPTSEMGTDLAIVRVMRMLSIPHDDALPTSPQRGKSAGCCPLHRRVAWMTSRLRFMNSFKCAPQFHPSSSTQCQRCGMLANAGSEGSHVRAPRVLRCFACEAEVEALPVPVPKRPSTLASL